MCGIVGFTGTAQAAPVLLDGLAKLEYRGYDSAGMAVENAAGKIEVVKAKGRLKVLREMTDGGNAVPGSCGIGHTRWATHGEPSVVNAHPHYSRDQKIAVVHNGIIENYLEIKERLTNKGFTFASQTDTEVVAQLLDYYYTGSSAGDALDAIARMMMHVRGSYALGILFADQPGVVYAVRKDSPLIVGRCENGSIIASDVPALLKYTRTVYYIDNLEIARLTPDAIEFFNIDKEPVQHEAATIEWDAEAAEKGGYEHFMMKEIHEQPAAVRDTLSPRLKDGKIDLSELELDEDAVRAVRRIYIIGCGSAYHVGMAARYVFESLARLPVEVDVASEFRYRDPVLDPDALALVISQSGETADTLAALRLCKERGVRTVGIVNVVGSSIAREADATMYTWAGPEISVATTKAYSTQLAACYLLATEFARVRGTLAEGQYETLVAEMEALPDKIAKILEDKERIQWFASKYASARDAFFIGRGLDYAVALEGSLKFKEISYIHSEAFAAGEMKHGPISLVENGTLVVGILTQPDLFEKSVSNMVEAKSRGAFLMGLTSYGNYSIEDTAGFTVYVPKTDPHFATSLAVIPLQLLAYYVSCAKGLDVDKPRNLAKSVTVE
ncbi:MAG TPA: glutamine--fructose-6-phosphate transaminase (isomerizing) [Candidatus Gemmiger excrementipullorum]|uniref:Glutamine--fructose-6-phosphate aminotransferase [isomerizing] n=1 Tax=Candidatus Gemmiger excrementipullorum TaxID=2838610 RepID=A0A9D1XZT0_9FIRM|nr:glutamine--fructose-6-phosphate transaminase (isomerizing) [Candidatus Gemmiger excrementipullorum]